MVTVAEYCSSGRVGSSTIEVGSSWSFWVLQWNGAEVQLTTHKHALFYMRVASNELSITAGSTHVFSELVWRQIPTVKSYEFNGRES